MWQGRYVSWNPIAIEKSSKWGNLFVEAIHDDWEGFRIWLRPENRNQGLVIVRFEAVLMYVNSDESDRLSVVEVEKNRVLNQGFWRVENSALVKEFKRQGAGISDEDNITHYVFITYSDCIDVLSMLEPEIINMVV